MNKFTFLTQSQLIDPVSPEAAQLGIHIFFHNPQLELHRLEEPV